MILELKILFEDASLCDRYEENVKLVVRFRVIIECNSCSLMTYSTMPKVYVINLYGNLHSNQKTGSNS